MDLAESVSIAMLTVLETLGPTERAVFVLREVFDRRGAGRRRGGEAAAIRQPLVGRDRVAALLSRLKTAAPAAVVDAVWLNGAPAGRVELAGRPDTAVGVVVADGRITRVYAVRNPHKPARLDEPATLSR